MKILHKPLLACSLAGAFLMNAQQLPQLYPNVQHIKTTDNAQDFHGFKLTNKAWAKLVARTPVQQLLKADSQEALKIKIKLKKHIDADENVQNLLKADGAYDLEIHKNKVQIAAHDSIGVFYALQTLGQLVKDDKIFTVEITDFPSVKYRGVVEGFYGTPWSTADRISQLKFYGTIKANTYIYGPKDDPYHSSPNWRKPYPPEQAAQIKKLVTVADKNFVDFVWAIHPGKDIQWTAEDRQNILKKFESMYDLGVRSFAVFFDDISGEGTDAHKQAALMNFLHEKFVQVKKDVKPLMLCPTDYNKSWADPSPDGYLGILGREMHPSIQIMWTGDTVVSDITKSTLEWVQSRIKRPALVWWNFPVSDYIRDHLLLGPSYGLEKDLNIHEMSGILSNPMEHAEASKVAIFGVADYAWNTTAYQPQLSWNLAIETLMPHSAAAYKLFSENNADPGKNGHRYRREESTAIAPHINNLKLAITEGKADREDFSKVKNYFTRMSKAEAEIISANDNPALIEEIKPWLEKFTWLAHRGLAQLNNYSIHSTNAKAYWTQMIQNRSEIDLSLAKQPIKGTKIIPVTGGLVLTPFVNFLQDWNNQKLIEKITGKKGTSTANPGIGSVQSNIDKLSQAQLLAGPNREILMKPILEVFEIQPKASFTIALSQPIAQGNIKARFESRATHWMKIEVSEDGNTWTSPTSKENNKRVNAEVKQPFKFVRVSNSSEKPVRLRLNQFIIANTADNNGGQTLLTHDRDVFSSYPLTPGNFLTEKSHLANPTKLYILTNSSTTALSLKVQLQDGTWKALPAKVKGLYMVVSLPEGVQAVQLQADAAIQIHEIFWK